MRPQVTFTVGGPPKTRKNDTSTDPQEIDWDVVAQKAAIVQQTSLDVAKIVAGAYAAKKLIDTVCEIAIIAAKRHI